jgi:acetylornithine/succinyldiaminopimelate/putrescine aminotransferase
MPLGKALGAGVPVGAALLSERVADAVSFGDHGSTYGGNLLACRAALVFLNALETGLITRVGTAGARLEAGLRSMAASHPAITAIRGSGLMWGLEVDEPVAERMVHAALGHGLLINRTAGTVIRLLPPLTISDSDIDEGITRLEHTFQTAAAEAT